MSDPFIGEVRLFGFNFNPRGWFTCAGALLPISTNSTLFSLLGTQFGGDGRTTFALPDLRGRAAISKGRHPGSYFDWRMGTAAGAEMHTLSILEMPSHNHGATFVPTSNPTVTVEVSTDGATEDTPAQGSYLARNDAGRSAGVAIYRSTLGDNPVELGGVTTTAGTGTVTVGLTGNGQSFSIVQPVLALNYCMANVGVYPPRS